MRSAGLPIRAPGSRPGLPSPHRHSCACAQGLACGPSAEARDTQPRGSGLHRGQRCREEEARAGSAVMDALGPTPTLQGAPPPPLRLPPPPSASPAAARGWGDLRATAGPQEPQVGRTRGQERGFSHAMTTQVTVIPPDMVSVADGPARLRSELEAGPALTLGEAVAAHGQCGAEAVPVGGGRAPRVQAARAWRRPGTCWGMEGGCDSGRGRGFGLDGWEKDWT